MSDQAPGQSEPSIQDRIGALLSPPQEQAPEKPELNPEAETSGAETQDAEPQEVQETIPDPTADWIEVEIDGEKLQVPPKFSKAFMQERDYTQKRQADAEYRKVVEIREQSLAAQEQTLQQLQPLFQQVGMIERELQGLQNVNWEQLRQEDPLQYSTKRADQAALMQQYQHLQGQVTQGQQFLTQQRQYAVGEAVKAAEPIIRKHVPDWGVEKSNQLGQFAIKHGASPVELSGLAARPWAVILLEKARQYDELQASKAQLPRKVQNLSPVAKPGAKSTVQTGEATSFRKAQETFRKSGGKDSGSLRALIRAKVNQT